VIPAAVAYWPLVQMDNRGMVFSGPALTFQSSDKINSAEPFIVT
jgi:hypothetical protein